MVPQDVGREEVAKRYLDREEELSYCFAVCMEVLLQHNIRQAVLGGFWKDLEGCVGHPGQMVVGGPGESFRFSALKWASGGLPSLARSWLWW